MSIGAMLWVWEHSRSRGVDRHVLLILADNGEPDEYPAEMPSVSGIMAKAGLDRAEVIESIYRLQDLGELVLTHEVDGPPTYRIVTTGEGASS